MNAQRSLQRGSRVTAMHHQTTRPASISPVDKSCDEGVTAPVRSGRLLRSSVAAVALAVALAGCTANPESRIADYATSTRTMEQGGNSLLSLAETMAADGDHAAAVPVFRRAHARDPNAAEPLVGLGRSLMALGQVAAAEHAFRDAVDRDDNDPDALAGLGSALVRLNRPEAAIALFEDALRIDFDHGEATRGLALALDMTGQHDAAIATYEQALDRDSEDLKLRNNYGLSLALFGESDAGVRVLEDVLRDDRAGPSQRQNMALAYVLAGNERDAVRMIAIDQDTRTVGQTLDYFRIIKMLAPEDRLAALVAGTTPPKQDTTRPANRSYDNDAETRVETARRIVGLDVEQVVEDPFPEPAPMPEPEPEPAPHEDADLSGIPLMAPGEGWSLQIAAYRKASQLVAGWKLLREKYFSIIGDLEPRRTEIDFGDRPEKPNGFFYRLNAGPLTSLEEATEKCRQMRDLGADCWVRPPEEDENAAPTPELFQ
ncbi:MAG: SPOR domain-containing protein [Alphaproteobacteria bacterium]|nr:MAG: SPOR domain-containing protein [Alphaproteobacteria bacterium]